MGAGTAQVFQVLIFPAVRVNFLQRELHGLSTKVLIEAIERTYSALDDPSELHTLGQDLARHLGSDAGDIVTERKDARRLTAWSSHGFDPAFLKFYDDTFLGHNPWFDLMLENAHGAAFSDREAPQDYLASAYVNEWVRAQGLGETLGAVLKSDANEDSWIGFTRAQGARPWSSEDAAFLTGLLPHLRRVIDLLSHRRAETQGIVDAFDVPVAVLDAEGRIVTLNIHAETILDGPDLRTDAMRRPIFIDPTANRMIELELRELRQPAAGVPVPSRDIPVRVGGDLRMLITTSRLPAAGGNGLVLIMRQTSGTPTIDRATLKELFSLTDTEVDLAAALAEGRGVVGFAEARGIRAATARWHLRNLEAKTGTSRIDELVSLIFRFARPGFGVLPPHMAGAPTSE